MTGQTLDAKLETSPLIYVKESNKVDGKDVKVFDFVHDTYRDFFLAKYFADEINEERMSVREAYVNYWSYEIDTNIWAISKSSEFRVFLSEWETILLNVVEMLSPHKAAELVDIISESYFHYKHEFDVEEFNPSFDDICLAAKLIGRANLETFIHLPVQRVIDEISNFPSSDFRLNALDMTISRKLEQLVVEAMPYLKDDRIVERLNFLMQECTHRLQPHHIQYMGGCIAAGYQSGKAQDVGLGYFSIELNLWKVVASLEQINTPLAWKYLRDFIYGEKYGAEDVMKRLAQSDYKGSYQVCLDYLKQRPSKARRIFSSFNTKGKSNLLAYLRLEMQNFGEEKRREWGCYHTLISFYQTLCDGEPNEEEIDMEDVEVGQIGVRRCKYNKGEINQPQPVSMPSEKTKPELKEEERIIFEELMFHYNAGDISSVIALMKKHIFGDSKSMLCRKILVSSKEKVNHGIINALREIILKMEVEKTRRDTSYMGKSLEGDEYRFMRNAIAFLGWNGGEDAARFLPVFLFHPSTVYSAISALSNLAGYTTFSHYGLAVSSYAKYMLNPIDEYLSKANLLIHTYSRNNLHSTFCWPIYEVFELIAKLRDPRFIPCLRKHRKLGLYYRTLIYNTVEEMYNYMKPKGLNPSVKVAKLSEIEQRV